MKILRLGVCVFSVASMVLGANAVFGADYPTKSIRMLCSGRGGGMDFTARLIAQALSGNLNQRVYVDNRPSGVIPGQVTSQAKPDGYTVLIAGSALWLLPLMRDNVPYDPMKDFSPITVAVTSTNILAVHPSLPVKSVKELIALAKARPGDLNFGTAGSGSASHLAGELFKALAGVNIVWVNYKAPGPAIMDLIAGRMQVTFGSARSTKAHVDAGKLKALAVTSPQRSPLYPDLPTIASALPGYELVAAFAMFAPAKTPAPIIARLNKEFAAVLKGEDLKKRLAKGGLVTVGSSPEQLTAMMKSDIARIGKVIKDVGIKG
ncbi:MAG: tripartite tricarboxylate transporter substrate binding protein [Gammaproteobacteria bacterium]|nr:tripartite tricarboxylate transporter substrate binding protein [Gammaproteobacteria bacterium]MDH3469329.1 tripartite tricarboxylate transporter substrate binding protein [Gammaproteobacteria bacterium]